MKPDYGTLRATQRTPDGTVVRRHEQEIDSYVENYWKLASATWGDQDVAGVLETDGTERTLENGSAAADTWELLANSTVTDRGLLIGSDGTAPTITDNALGSQLTTNVSHGAITVGTGSVSAPDSTLTITRTFTNNTGSTLTINEAGLVAAHTHTGASVGLFLMLRDVGDPIDSVADGNNTTIEFDLTVTV